MLRGERADLSEALVAVLNQGLGRHALGELEEPQDRGPEPLGGAHRDPQVVAERLRGSILRFFKQTDGVAPEVLLKTRYEWFRKIGAFTSRPLPSAPPAANPST